MRNLPSTLFCISIFTLLSIITGCTSKKNNIDDRIISVSLMPHKFFVNAIAGDDFRVNVLLPAGANHHTYEPTTKQLIELENSKILLINGFLPFEEEFIEQSDKRMSRLKIIRTTTGIDLLQESACESESHSHVHDHNQADPHTWLSLVNAKTEAKNILDALIELNPDGTVKYISNFNQLIKQIDSLHFGFINRLKEASVKSFMIFHPALGYLARDYGLEQYAIEKSGKNPTPFELKKMIDIAQTQNIGIIFIQKEFDAENAKIISQETGARIVIIDPMNENWLDNLNGILSELLSQ